MRTVPVGCFRKWLGVAPIVALALVLFGSPPALAEDPFPGLIWSEVYNGGFGHDAGYGVAIDSRRNVVVSGYRGTEPPGTPQGQGYNAYLRKYDKFGAFLCDREEMGPGTPAYPATREVTDIFYDVEVDGRDDIVVAGVMSGNYSIQQYYVGGYANKYDAACAPVWAAPAYYKYPGDSAWQSFYSMALDGSGNIYPTGVAFGGWSPGPEHQWATAKYDADGVLQSGFPVFYNWSPSYAYPDYSQDVAIDSLGNIVVVGYRGEWINSAASFDWHVRKYTPTGALVWADTYQGAASLHDVGYRVVIDGSDNPIVVGYTNKGTNNGAGANYDWLVIKYARDGVGSIGQRLWTKTYESAAGMSETATAVALDADDNVIVGGGKMVNATTTLLRLALLDSADGTELGERVFAEPANTYPLRLAWRDGSLAVAGYIANTAAPFNDLYVALLAPPDVLSSVSADPNPTNLASVDFTVTFTGPVTGVDATDFALATAGLTGAAITGVSGAGAIWTVTVDTGAGDGTVRLEVTDDDSIVDAALNPLGGVGLGNGDFTAGEAYAVDRTNPGVLSVERDNPDPTSALSVEYHVTFSEAVAGVDVTDFTLTTTGLTGAAVAEVSGSGAFWLVSVATGRGNGTIRLDVTDDDSIVDAASNPLGGVGAGNGDFTGGETFTVNRLSAHASAGTYDGWVLESSETSRKGGTLSATATTISVGDDVANKQYLGILHFDTSGLPDSAVVTAATLKVRKQVLVGTSPFTTHGALLVDIRSGFFGTAATLAAADFQGTPTKAAVAKFGAPAGTWYSAALNAAGRTAVNRTGTTQLRLRFTKDDNNDRGADCVKFYSGNAPVAARPQLIVEYYVP